MATKKGQIKYCYSVDEKGELVHISSLTDATRHVRKLYCLQCGQEMVANLGKIKARHFSHKRETACDGESYLHKLAKRLIRETFMSAENFPITFLADVTCNEFGNCMFAEDGRCVDNGVKLLCDLKVWKGKSLYDKCEEEVSVGDFRADLLLTYTKDCDREPIFIEIFKTHKSSDVKVNSKYRIIETLPIKSEEDIFDILQRGFVEDENCTLYNFIPNTPSIRIKDVPIDRFVLYENGAGRVCYVQCEKVNQRIDPRSVAELNMRPHGFSLGINDQDGTLGSYQTGLLYFVKRGMPIRNCILCKYRRYNEAYSKFVCILYKTLGHESPFPRQTMANHCQRYELSPYFKSYSITELEKEVSEVISEK